MFRAEWGTGYYEFGDAKKKKKKLRTHVIVKKMEIKIFKDRHGKMERTIIESD